MIDLSMIILFNFRTVRSACSSYYFFLFYYVTMAAFGK